MTSEQQELVQVIQSDAEFAEKISAINNITTEDLLIELLNEVPEKNHHLKNAIKIKLLLLEPKLAQYYGQLQLDDDLSKDSHKYGFGIVSTLYVEHAKITVTDLQRKMISIHQFDGAPPKEREVI